MTLDELLDKASAAFDDGFVGKLPRTEAEETEADTMGLFIVRELRETYDAGAEDETQLDEARRVLAAGVKDLERVIDALY